MIVADSLQIIQLGAVLLQEVSFEVARGSITAFLGRNGVGKSTLLRSLAGHHREVTGRLSVNGVPILGMSPNGRARLGISYAAQERGYFPDLTVSEHFQIAVLNNSNRVSRERKEELENGLPILGERKQQKARTLSGGERQLLKVACAIVAAKHVILLDEPSQGVQRSSLERMTTILRRIAERDGLAVLLAEQNLRFALETSDEWCVLQDGGIEERGRSDQAGVDSKLVSLLSI